MIVASDLVTTAVLNTKTKKLRTKFLMLVISQKKLIMTLKLQTSKKNISLILITINL